MKDNKVIAEFMGIKYVKGNDDRCGLYTLEGHGLFTEQALDELEYRVSWDWLNPVVKKCMNIYNDHSFDEGLLEINIEKVYRAVLEFIKWYNSGIKI